MVARLKPMPQGGPQLEPQTIHPHDAHQNYPVWQRSNDPFAKPSDYIKSVRLAPMTLRKFHLMRPDLIGYPLMAGRYA